MGRHLDLIVAAVKKCGLVEEGLVPTIRVPANYASCDRKEKCTNKKKIIKW
jgi:hypothetical protein